MDAIISLLLVCHELFVKVCVFYRYYNDCIHHFRASLRPATAVAGTRCKVCFRWRWSCRVGICWEDWRAYWRMVLPPLPCPDILPSLVLDLRAHSYCRMRAIAITTIDLNDIVVGDSVLDVCDCNHSTFLVLVFIMLSIKTKLIMALRIIGNAISYYDDKRIQQASML